MGVWEVTVEGGKPVDVKVGEDEVFIIRTVTLDEASEEIVEHVRVEVATDKKKFLIAHLHPKKWPFQDQLLILTEDFTIINNSTYYSVSLLGQKLRKY